MAKFVMRDPATRALEVHYSWVEEDGKGSSKMIYQKISAPVEIVQGSAEPGNQKQRETYPQPLITSSDIIRGPPQILEPKWSPSEPVYHFPIQL
jgi:hypothetical protein